MGFMDKLKNIFFEEDDEDEEIEEPVSPKNESKINKKRSKEEFDNVKEKLKDNIAKKIEIPKRNKTESTENDSLEYEVNKTIEKKPDVVKEPEKVEKKVVEVKPKRENKINTELIFDDDDFSLDFKPKVTPEKTRISENKEIKIYKPKDNKEIKTAESKIKLSQVKQDYPKSTVAYSKKESVKEKTFTPSPIISPIYGILDKNYKKEEVKDNKEIRISSRPSRMDLDSVRNKAFGDLEYDLMNEFKDSDENEVTKEVSKDKKEQKKTNIQKITSGDNKPTIDKVTLGEADEYYNDLGLAYNTDYKDLSKDLNDGKISEKEEKKDDNLEDNLFDLIESMYDKEE